MRKSKKQLKRNEKENGECKTNKKREGKKNVYMNQKIKMINQ